MRVLTEKAKNPLATIKGSWYDPYGYPAREICLLKHLWILFELSTVSCPIVISVTFHNLWQGLLVNWSLDSFPKHSSDNSHNILQSLRNQ